MFVSREKSCLSLESHRIEHYKEIVSVKLLQNKLCSDERLYNKGNEMDELMSIYIELFIQNRYFK